MSDPERREYSRVDAFIALHTRAVPKDECCKLQAWACVQSVSLEFQALPELEDGALAECIRIMNSKLDLVLNALMHRDKDFLSLKTSCVNISGSGLCFNSKEEYPLDETLELKMVFPETPDMMLCVYGRVVKSERGDSSDCRTCVRYTEIDEEIRDKIVKYVFDKQREMIRKSRRL